MSLPVVDGTTINFSQSGVFVDRSRKFVIPIPKLDNGGEPLVSPDDSSMLRDNTNARGIVFHDGATDLWKGVLGDGTEAIVFNDILSPQFANAIYVALEHSFPLLSATTPEQYGHFLNWAYRALNLYNTTFADIVSLSIENSPLTRTAFFAGVTGPFGYMEGKKLTPYRAVWVANSFVLKTGRNQKELKGGAVLVTDGNDIWDYQTCAFKRGWCLSVEGVEYPLTGGLSKVVGLPKIKLDA